MLFLESELPMLAEHVKVFQRLNQEGKTIIIVTHDSAVAAICGKTYIMNSGKLSVEKTV